MSAPTPQNAAAPPSNPTVKKQKLKFACDACSRRKISCPKQQPECGRCISEGRRCVYSPSCRNGKRKSTRPPMVSQPSEQPSEPMWTSSSMRENENPFSPSGMLVGSPMTGDMTTDMSPGDISIPPWSLPNGLCFTNEFLQEPMGQPMTSVEPNDTLLGNYSYEDVPMYTGSDFNVMPSYVRPSIWPLQQNSPLVTPGSYRSDSTVDSTPWSGSSYSSSSVTTIDTALLIDQTLPELNQRPHDSCFTRTCTLLKTLKRPSSKACIFDSAHSPSLSDQTTLASKSIEKILLTTDVAIEHVTSVMQCACHTTSSVRYALTLALLEVMSWYEIIVLALNRQAGKSGRDIASPTNSFDEEFESSCSVSPRTQAEGNDSDLADMIAVSTVSIGDMKLQHGEANSVLSTLVRSRIGKIRKMVHTMSSDCTFF